MKNTEKTMETNDLTPGLGPAPTVLEPPEVPPTAPPQGSTLRNAKRCYDLYLWAFAKARSGGVVDVEVSDEVESELGADVVLLHRRAILAGVVAGAQQDGYDTVDRNGVPMSVNVHRPKAPITPRQLWDLIHPDNSGFDFGEAVPG